MYWRRYAIKEIPTADPKKFDLWLHQRWIEKDELLEYYAANGAFPEDQEPTEKKAMEQAPGLRKRVGGKERVIQVVGGKERAIQVVGGTNVAGVWEGPVETEVKIAGWGDVFAIFSVVG